MGHGPGGPSLESLVQPSGKSLRHRVLVSAEFVIHRSFYNETPEENRDALFSLWGDTFKKKSQKSTRFACFSMPLRILLFPREMKISMMA